MKERGRKVLQVSFRGRVVPYRMHEGLPEMMILKGTVVDEKESS